MFKSQKSTWIIVAALASSVGWTQTEVDVGWQEEGQAAGAIQAPQTAQQPRVVILNSQGQVVQPQQTQQVVQQPITYVEASPLTESRAEQMRKARQGAEVETEQKIVEKLEASRLEDERARAERLFGNRLDPLAREPAPQPQPVYTPPPAPPVVEIPAGPEAEKSNTVNIEKVEIIHPTPQPPPEKSGLANLYIGATAGMTEYTEVDNVQSNHTLGVSVGTDLENRVSFEALFNYSNYYVEEYWRFPVFKELDQYEIGGAVKYRFLQGMVQPFVGGQATYVYRKYSDRIYAAGGFYDPYYYRGDETEVTTSAFNVGLMVGLDVLVSSNFSIGADFRYSMNVMSKNDSDLFRSEYLAPVNTTPIEELSTTAILLNGKLRF